MQRCRLPPRALCPNSCHLEGLTQPQMWLISLCVKALMALQMFSHLRASPAVRVGLEFSLNIELKSFSHMISRL